MRCLCCQEHPCGAHEQQQANPPPCSVQRNSSPQCCFCCHGLLHTQQTCAHLALPKLPSNCQACCRHLPPCSMVYADAVMSRKHTASSSLTKLREEQKRHQQACEDGDHPCRHGRIGETQAQAPCSSWLPSTTARSPPDMVFLKKSSLTFGNASSADIADQTDP